MEASARPPGGEGPVIAVGEGQNALVGPAPHVAVAELFVLGHFQLQRLDDAPAASVAECWELQVIGNQRNEKIWTSSSGPV